MTTPVEDMQAAIAALRVDVAALLVDVDVLKAAAARDEQERRLVREWLDTVHRGDATNPKPGEARQQA